MRRSQKGLNHYALMAKADRQAGTECKLSPSFRTGMTVEFLGSVWFFPFLSRHPQASSCPGQFQKVRPICLEFVTRTVVRGACGWIVHYTRTEVFGLKAVRQ